MSASTQDAPQAKAAAHPSLQVYDTLTKKKRPFETVEPGKVGVYLCGPTVYDKAHIGHMVGPVIFDCIKRYLSHCGYKVFWVVNITDVDDKLIKKANERGITMLEVAEENIQDYNDNLAALGVDQIDAFPRATDCMDEIVALVESLVERGFAYASEGDVYFDVGKDREYGKLSNRTVDALQGDGGGQAERKRHAADFALWKGAKPGEPSWPSPWGDGRPGWHIECSAMSKKLLGETFDIHGGGLDLVFPHHENEVAQSECCHGKPMVTYWAHNGLLRSDPSAGKIGGKSDRDGADTAGDADATGDASAGGKMSRSKGAGGLAELIGRQGGERIRFFLLRTHYRSTVLFSEPAIEEAGVGLDTFYRFFKRYERVTGSSFYALSAPKSREAGAIAAGQCNLLDRVAELRTKFLAAMDDDFNTGGAIGELFELARVLNKHCDDAGLETKEAAGRDLEAFRTATKTLKELASVLGVFIEPPASAAGGGELLGQVMQLVIDLRAESRKAKNFAVADAIRDGLKPTGIVLEDRAGGTEWEGGDADALEGVMQMLIELRATSRQNKDFATADALRDRLTAIGVTIEDRPGGAEWTAAS
ncbi:Cysteine--tRNA ligase [Pseudobythopirellula maris]|uniref:Cysteine--tRNA ligase n=1 Tax=Pseudobythopirellula maris TaxID=2527991 RepID=A0A5C5ZHI5_9BACT|nr:cysteine--tRNA ligase [Pseudobythopirellula maris]TWT86565.1 Cysteine--tRNA ligase [Pseudobythopirellula maris]